MTHQNCMTVENARKSLCPLSFNHNSNRTVQHNNCKASECMAWRWYGSPKSIMWASNPINPVPKKNWVLIEDMGETGTGRKCGHYMELPETGYCGLAGKIE